MTGGSVKFSIIDHIGKSIGVPVKLRRCGVCILANSWLNYLVLIVLTLVRDFFYVFSTQNEKNWFVLVLVVVKPVISCFQSYTPSACIFTGTLNLQIIVLLIFDNLSTFVVTSGSYPDSLHKFYSVKFEKGTKKTSTCDL